MLLNKNTSGTSQSVLIEHNQNLYSNNSAPSQTVCIKRVLLSSGIHTVVANDDED